MFRVAAFLATPCCTKWLAAATEACPFPEADGPDAMNRDDHRVDAASFGPLREVWKCTRRWASRGISGVCSATLIGLVAVVVACSGAEAPPENEASRADDISRNREWTLSEWRVPISETEIIVGRAVSDDDVIVLTDSKSLVRLNPFRGTVQRVQVSSINTDENVWGLARLEDGTLWTLVGRATLTELSSQGKVVRKIDLRVPHLALFGWKNRLLYQAIDLSPPSAALAQGPPGNHDRTPCGSLQTRLFNTVRPEMWALNLVKCGVGRADELPCWFQNEVVIDRIRVDGKGSPCRLDNLKLTRPAALTRAEDAPHPIWDAYIPASGELWVLITSDTPASANGRSGWEVFRYSPQGRLIAGTRLPVPARLILGVREDFCYLLAHDSRITRVKVF